MRSSVILVVLACGAAAAETPGPAAPELGPSASESRYYAGAGAYTTADRLFSTGAAIEGGVRLEGRPVVVHALAAVGSVGGPTSGNGETAMTGAGWVQRAAVGIEVRMSAATISPFVGVDLGFQRASWNGDGEAPQTYLGAIAIARLGLGIGDESLRMRFALDGSRYWHWDASGVYRAAGGLGASMTLLWGW